MKKCIILAQSEVAAESLKQVLSLHLPLFPNEPDNYGTQTIIIPDDDVRETDEAFDYVASVLDTFFLRETATYSFGRHVVIVDTVDPAHLNPLTGRKWEAFIAMLILAFPEINWIFGLIRENTGSNETGQTNAEGTLDSETCLQKQNNFHWISAHSLFCFFSVVHDPIFDGSGLRRFILQNLQNTELPDTDDKKRKIAPSIPLRSRIAVAMDDEFPYAYFNAYAAYRFGYRAFAVYRNRQALDLLGRNARELEGFELSFEDIFINFPDQTNHEHYSDLKRRSEKTKNENTGVISYPPVPGVAKAKTRVFVSTQHRHGGDEKKNENNTKFIKSIDAKEVRKPFSGLFSLWQESKLSKNLNQKTDQAILRTGQAPGFEWPPKEVEQPGDLGDTGHSAPGRLVQIAEFMIARAERLLARGEFNIPKCVFGAVLASSAQEILGDRTPTTSITALSLKHQFEVLAECQFSGVEYHIEIKPRFTELKGEFDAIGRWFGKKQRKQAVENAQMMILNRIIDILRSGNQFDEERDCMNRVRRLHRRLWLRAKPWRYVFFGLPLWYMEKLLSSFPLFLGMIMGWIGFVWALLAGGKWMGWTNSKAAMDSFGYIKYLNNTIAYFTGANEIIHHTWYTTGITFFTIFIGVAHLGVFISQMYSLVSRK